MSVEAMAIALHHSRARSSTARLILVGIANHDGDGGAWPTVRTLGHYAAVQDRAVQNALTELIRLGEIDREVQAGGTAEIAHYDRPNLYHFKLKCPPHCDRTTAHRLICEACGKAMPKSSQSVRFHKKCEPKPTRQHPVQQDAPGASETTGGMQPGAPKPDLETSVKYIDGEIHNRTHVGNRASAHEYAAYGAAVPASAGTAAPTAQAPEMDAYGGSHRPAVASTAAGPIDSPQPSSDELERDPNACPRWRDLPHTPDAHGTCIDCGAPVPVRVNASTGEIH